MNALVLVTDESRKIEIEKLPLPIFIDNSKSIQHLGVNNEAKNVLKEFQKNADLENKFNVQFFSFDAEYEDVLMELHTTIQESS